MPWLGQNGLTTIVGVARDLKYAAIDADAAPELFFHYAAPISSITLAMRVDCDPIAAAPAIRSALSAIDPTQSFYNIKTLEDVLFGAWAATRLIAGLLCGVQPHDTHFAGTAAFTIRPFTVPSLVTGAGSSRARST